MTRYRQVTKFRLSSVSVELRDFTPAFPTYRSVSRDCYRYNKINVSVPFNFFCLYIRNLHAAIEKFFQFRSLPQADLFIEKQLKTEYTFYQIFTTPQITKEPECFESRFSMPSDRFYERYQSGETDDDMDTMRWAAEVQAFRKLTEIEIVS